MRIIAGLIFLVGIELHGANVSGYVADAETGETIIGVNVIVEGTDRGASTDVNGFFIIRSLSPGRTTIRYSHIAYEESRETVDIATKDIFLGTIKLNPTTLQGEAIEVIANRGNIIKKDMDIASFQVDPIVLREVPQLGKDVFELIKYSPSVTISDPISPLYHVRGSDAGENLIQLDGITIYNPQHFLGSKAIFNPYAIKNIELLVGGFDAEYGGRNSSILYITSREGHKEDVRGEFKLSTTGLEGAVEFPVKVGGTAMVSGRVITSLTNRILLGMPNVIVDFNGSYQITVGRTKMRYSVFYARDYVDYDFARLTLYFSDPVFENYSTGFLTNSQNRALGVRSRSILAPNLILESQLYYSGFEVNNKNFFKFSTRDTVQNVDVVLNYETRIINKISDITAKANLTYFAFFNQTIKLGFEQNIYRFFNETGAISSQSISTGQRSHLQSFYFQDKIELGPLLLKVGLRNSRFSPEGKWRQEPRASLAFSMSNTTIKAAWGNYYQYIKSMNTQDFELSQFLEYYYPLQRIEPLMSTHSILGIEGKLSDRIEYSVTGYYKELKTLYRFDYNSTVESLFAYQAALDRGKGEAYGLEFLVRGEMGRFSGWTGYSYSRSTRSYPSIQNGKIFLYNGDQTHNLKMILLYKVTRDITASTAVQFTSGFPRTWETGMVSHYSYDPVTNSVGVYPEYITPAKNNVRYPARVILDMGWKKKLRSGFGYRLAEYIGSDEAYYFMAIKNLLFLRRNPYIYIYFPNYGYYGLDFEYFPMVSIGYSIRFKVRSN